MNFEIESAFLKAVILLFGKENDFVAVDPKRSFWLQGIDGPS